MSLNASVSGPEGDTGWGYMRILWLMSVFFPLGFLVPQPLNVV